MKLRIAIALMFLVTASTAANAPKPNLEKFTQCLTDKNVKMYGTFWCGHCNDQKALFADAAKSIPYVECSEGGQRRPSFACVSMGIKRTPTWIFADGTRYEGLMTLEQLSEKSGCKLQ